MSLSPGSRIGVYEVVGSLGAGGMGEVYRARDTKLGREVALKILPDLFAADPERLARFEREARTLASLNHPHIAQLHGFEDSGGTHALVMELVAGEDLSVRIKRGAIPLDEALAIAKQITQALEAAHEQGIVHRDLKPANIKVREDGTVKVLDFGLAKAMEGPAGTGAASGDAALNSPTITTPAMTMRGVILGTAAYMAPEQAKGKVIDKRADIWAFGCVFFEMLTGRRAFAGDDVSDTLASVLRAEVDWTGVPAPVVRLLKKCLEKDPRRRLHDIGDAWDLIGDPDESARPQAARRPWAAWSVAAVLFAATTVLAILHFGESQPTLPLVHFEIQPPAKNAFDIYLTLSPDGRRLAFTARDDAGVTRLWVRDLDAPDARPLAGTEGAGSLFWSPDSRHLAFAVDRTVKRVDASGGPPQTLCEVPDAAGSGSWAQDGVIVFGTRGAGALWRIPATGGVPARVTAVDSSRGETFHSFPFFLPDGRHFLYYRQSNRPELQGIYAGSLDASPDQQSTARIVATTQGPVRVSRGPSGDRLLFLMSTTLMAQPFDARRLQVSGEPTPVAQQIGSSGSFGFFSASASDVLAYRTGLATSINFDQLTWLDRKGQPVNTLGEPRSYTSLGSSLVMAPDGSRAIAAVSPTPSPDLWLIEFARGISTRFTFHASAELNPVWSPDGARIVFRSNREGPGDLYVKDTGGTSDETVLFRSPDPETPTNWSPDGRFLLFFTTGVQGSDLWVFPFDGAKAPVSLLKTPFNESGAHFSPDGRSIAYMSNESGRSEIYLRPFTVSPDGGPSVGPKWQVSTAGGGTVHWRRDGKELFYRAPSGAVMAVDVSVGSAVQTGLPRQLFGLAQTVTNWDVTPDGQRFLVSLPVAPPASDPIAVVLNWQAGLKP